MKRRQVDILGQQLLTLYRQWQAMGGEAHPHMAAHVVATGELTQAWFMGDAGPYRTREEAEKAMAGK